MLGRFRLHVLVDKELEGRLCLMANANEANGGDAVECKPPLVGTSGWLFDVGVNTRAFRGFALLPSSLCAFYCERAWLWCVEEMGPTLCLMGTACGAYCLLA